MTLDQTAIGQVVAMQMQALERDYNDDDEKHRIGAVITIVEILTPDGEPKLQQVEGENINVSQGYRSAIRTRNNVGDPYRVLGIIRAAEQAMVGQLGGGQVPEE
ncbi:MAG: hypothetical protein ACRDK2_12900 [Solirubrobacteraceae bacterium]